MARDSKILVPKSIELEVQVFIEEAQIAATQTGKFDKEDIKLIKPEYVQLSGVELLESFVFLCSGVRSQGRLEILVR